MIQVLAVENYKKMPWKNGQGFTLEIARSHGTGLSDFDWRISIADVKSAGAFSHFPNRKRIIGVLDGGTGLILNVDQKAPVTLHQKQFFAFDGENDVYAELLDEPIRDFNLIYNPDRYCARLQWINAQAMSSWISDADRVIIFNATDQLELYINDEQRQLTLFETALVENDGKSLQYVIGSQTAHDFCLIELFTR